MVHAAAAACYHDKGLCARETSLQAEAKGKRTWRVRGWSTNRKLCYGYGRPTAMAYGNAYSSAYSLGYGNVNGRALIATLAVVFSKAQWKLCDRTRLPCRSCGLREKEEAHLNVVHGILQRNEGQPLFSLFPSDASVRHDAKHRWEPLQQQMLHKCREQFCSGCAFSHLT